MTARAAVLCNLLTVTAVGAGWTTASLTVSDQTVNAPTATNATTLTAIGTNNLGPGGGQITLVTPYLLRERGSRTYNRAGYGSLTLHFSAVPEPEALPLLGMAAAALLGRAVRSRRRQGGGSPTRSW